MALDLQMPSDEVDDPHTPIGQCLHHSDRRVGTTNIGTARYLIFFPALQRCIGLEIVAVARPGHRTQWTKRVTEIETDPERVYAELFR